MSQDSHRSIADYLTALRRNVAHSDATEHTHRPALKNLLEALGGNITATNDPKRIKCGAPDFNITRRKIPLGHVETKDIGSNLNEMERGRGPNGEQFTRYRDGLPNWILTDYLDFRWYVAGEKRLAARIANFDGKATIKALPSEEGELAQLLNAFFKQSALTIGTAKDLAERLAGMARIIRDLIRSSFQREIETGWLHSWLTAFRKVLIPDLTPFLSDREEEQEIRPPAFDDMFAQTLAYGLFASRVNTSSKEFFREIAAFNLPKTNPFLRKLFSEIAGVDMPETIAWAVDDIVELLKHADMHKILKDFGKGKGNADPVVHFYETFLSAYDPKMREVRGVYYTPEPVVSYIVRSADHLLRTRFNRPKGLADENTLILDPATGTATFLYFVVNQIYLKFAKQKGAWDSYVDKHLLDRVFGFELLMAPYAIAHLKLSMRLQQTGYTFGSNRRLGIYLTNTLEEAAEESEQLFARWIAEEANAAAKIKRDDPILVILGNPPYSRASQNRGQWIQSLLADYKRNLNEKKLNLEDDFIKFIRFAQWRIERTGFGILGFITNNTYLDSLTRRRMRECLLNTFNEVYIFNLHGDSRKKEVAPDGTEDKNVFDIQQGVAIMLAIKQQNNKQNARVFYAEIWGARKKKYDVLFGTDITKTHWKELHPQSPNYFFVPRQDARAEEELGSILIIKDAFSIYGSGFNTDRDSLFLDFEKEILIDRMRKFFSGNYDEKFRDEFDVHASSSYDPEERAKRFTFDDKNVHPVVYRPFDVRFAYYQQGFTSRPVFEVQRNMLRDNLALVSARQSKEPFGVLAVRNICTHKIVTVYDRSSLFPLYVYPPSDGELNLSSDRHPNLSPALLKVLAEKLKLPQTGAHGLPKGITPQDIFHYAYAVFYSPTYRARYAEFLKIDFPHLPLTSDPKLFRALATKGEELTALHLIKSPKLNDFITEFPEKGDNVVEKFQQIDKDERVWVNKTQYFDGVPNAVWEFHIGGYQVCKQWLKERKGRKLSYADIEHYQKIVLALNETIRIMDEIDSLIPRWPMT